MFSASPATAALEICCVWWTTKEEALADAAPYTVRSVLVPAASFVLGEHVEELLGGRRNASQSFHEHQPRYGFLDPLRVVVLRPHPLSARMYPSLLTHTRGL